MIVPIIAVGAGLVGLYLYKKKHDVAAAVAAAPSSPSNGYVGATVPAANPSGVISYKAEVTVPGFNNQLREVAVPPPATPINYPAATTTTDPNVMHGTVAKYQAAQPAPSGVYYYPADGDVWPIISARLGGTPKARIIDPKNNASVVLSILPMADVGKLNGFVSLRDADNWVKAKKPIELPAGSWHDNSGPVQFAMGYVR